tara:strand:- start:148 stop:1539 length:1392 start_codon:yes stop_codon:yes gene_type:complete
MDSNMNKTTQVAYLLSAGLFIAGCNGSSGSADKSTTNLAANQAPIAIAGINQQVKQGDRVQLDGTSSVDYDKDLITYQWRFVSTPHQSSTALDDNKAVSPSFVADEIGTYLLELTVNDGKTTSRPNQVKIVAVTREDNSPPTINLTPGHSENLANSHMLNSWAKDADGDQLYFKWEIINQPEGSLPTIDNPNDSLPRISTDTIGDYEVKVTVTDGYESVSGTTTVSFYYQNLPPIAQVGPAMLAIEGMTIPLDASLSRDPNSDPITYKWSFTVKPDGSNAVIDDPSAPVTSYVADVSGEFAVTVEVSDGEFSDFPYRATYVRVAPLDGPHAKVFVDQTNMPLLLPFKQNQTIDKSEDSGALPEYYELGSYTFEAVGRDITITATSIGDDNNIVLPVIKTDFATIRQNDVYVIAAGTKETLRLLAPPTSGEQARPSFALAWSLSGPNDFTMIERVTSNYHFISR